MVAASVLLFACRFANRHPNILLITLDTTRADRLGCYGSRAGLTPSLDQLAAEGCLFESAYTACPLTLPAHASLLTGRYPFEHGVRANGENRLPDAETTLAEILRKHGYETAAFVGSFVLDSRFGLDQGFDYYDDEITAPVVLLQNRLLRERSADEVATRAIQWLRSRGSRPWFCWVHFFDPHYPYRSWSSVFGERFRTNSYDAEIAYMDLQIGRLWNELRRQALGDRTLVIALADHGESLGEHGEAQHGLTLYQAAVRIPIIMRWPARLPRSARITEPASIVDVMPTILDLLRIPSPPLSGRSCLPQLRGGAAPAQPCYMETHMPFHDYGWAPLAGLVDVPWKYILAPRPELYNVAEDPLEIQDLHGQRPDIAASLATRLLETLSKGGPGPSEAVSLSAAERQSLMSLGYLGGRGAAPDLPEWSYLPDIKDMLPLVQLSNDAQTHVNEGRPLEALPLAQDLVRRDPQNPTFQLLLATTLGAASREDEAEPILAGLLAAGHQHLPALVHLETLKLLAACREHRGDRSGAERLLREALRVDPEFVEAMNGLAWLLATGPEITPDQASEALELGSEAARLTARRDASILDTLAAACAAAGRFDEAVAIAEEARGLAASEGHARLAEAVAERAALYRAGHRFIEQAPSGLDNRH